MGKFKSVNEFLEEAKKEERAAFEKERDELLLSLGLDEEKTVRCYSDNRTPLYEKYEKESGKYYYDYEKKAPMSVSDEEYLEIKRIVEKKNYVNSSTAQSAKVLRILAKVVLVIGILSGLVLFFSTMMVDGRYYDKEFNPMCIAYLVSSVLMSIAYWAFTNAIADIVDNTSKIANRKGDK